MNEPRRFGAFSIPRDIIDKSPEVARAALSGLIPVRAELRFDTDAIDYLALGECFDECPAYEIAPRYEARFEMTDRGEDQVPRFVPMFRGWHRLEK